MSAATCIPDLVEQGKLTGQRAKEAMRLYRRHEARFLGEMSPEAAAVAASQAVVDEMDRVAAIKERRAGLQVKAQQRMAAEMATYQGPNKAKAAEAMLAADAAAAYMNVDAQAGAIRGRAHAMVEGVLAKHRRNLFGEAKDKSGLDDLVRERFGENSGNAAAKELSDAFGLGSEYLRQRHNRAGGDIGSRADWGLPQGHDGMKLRAAGFDQWKGDMLDWLGLDRMIDGDTGRSFTPDALADALDDGFKAIASDGWSRAEPGAGGRGSLAVNRGKHRFFIFKDADSWMAYQAKYGSGNAFTAMMGHIEGMSREIALMERLGPNPEASLQWLKDVVQKQAATDMAAGQGDLDAARGAVNALDNLYGVVSGSINSPVNERWARRMSGTRSFLTSTLLGSASISAITDLGFQTLTRAYNGLPATSALAGYIRLLNPLDAADRRLAVRLGLQAEDAARSMSALGRFVDQGNTPEVAARMSDFVLRVSGLNVWTQAGRWDFGLTILGHMADERSKPWAALDSGFKGMLERYGIAEADWSAIGASELRAERGGEWVDPTKLDEDLGDRILRMAATEVDYAVPSATARARATLSFGQQPGTLGGEIMRNMFLFKSFGVSMILTHGARMMSEKGWSRLGYFLGLTATTTLLGALAVQLKEIAKGRDPLDMTSGDFWMKAALMGGGYGIFGDFIGSFKDADRNQAGPIESAAGPVAGLALDAGKAVTHGISEGAEAIGLAEDDGKSKLDQDAIRALKRYMPGGSIWYTRAAYERGLVDWLQSSIDPDYAASWSRVENGMRDRTGQEYYWRPGESIPDRMPRMSEAPG